MQAAPQAAVALIFFIRPAQLRVVFDRIRRAKPPVLFLIQDGARAGNAADAERIRQCRQIVEEIDWDCEVHRDYAGENLGCGRRIYSGIKRAFERVEELIILEDDCIPSDSFFPFCGELLARYRTDARVGMISGMNHLGVCEDVQADYFFAYAGSIAGWATWKRCWDVIDFDLGFLREKGIQDTLSHMARYGPQEHREAASGWRRKLHDVEAGVKFTSWSYQFGICTILNSQVILVPKYNLMGNHGAADGATNSAADERMINRAVRSIYHLDLYEYTFPLKHPRFVAVDYQYGRAVTRRMHPRGLRKALRKLESIARRLFLGDFRGLWRAAMKKLGRA